MRSLTEGERRVINHFQSVIMGNMYYMGTIDNIPELEKVTASMIGKLNCIKTVLEIRLVEKEAENNDI